jgi:hypothetical protein
MSDKPLRLEYLDPADLNVNPSNWRRHPESQKAALRGIIGEVGWAGALLYNEQTGRLIDGHARKEQFSGQPVPVLVGSWDEATEAKILATLDPIAAMARADADSLDALLRNVQTGSEAVAEMLRDLAAKSGCEWAKPAEVAVWVKTNPPPAMAEGVMTSAFEFVWMLTNNDMPTRRIASASFQMGTFSNVFEHATAYGHDASIHGAVSPVGVVVHFIRGLSQAQSLIYEPFCGSGTTLIAAEQLGRKCYGMEISPAYCDVIVKRWETLTGKSATRG